MRSERISKGSRKDYDKIPHRPWKDSQRIPKEERQRRTANERRKWRSLTLWLVQPSITSPLTRRLNPTLNTCKWRVQIICKSHANEPVPDPTRLIWPPHGLLLRYFIHWQLEFTLVSFQFHWRSTFSGLLIRIERSLMRQLGQLATLTLGPSIELNLNLNLNFNSADCSNWLDWSRVPGALQADFIRWLLN